MRAHYDFSQMKARRNPYTKLLKQSVTIRLDRDTVKYFRSLAETTGLPYQSLINLYLRDCAVQGRKLSFTWSPKNSISRRLLKKGQTQGGSTHPPDGYPGAE